NSCALDRGAASQTCVCEINHELQKIESSVTEETEEKLVKQSAEMPHLPASVDDSFEHSDDYTVSVLDMRMLGTNQRHLHEFLELREVDWQRFKRSQLNCSFDFVGEQKLVRWWQVVSEFCWLGISCGTTTSVKRTQYNTTSVQPQYLTNLVSGEARYLLLYGFMNVRADTEDVKICQGLLSLLQLYCGHEIGRVTRKLQQRKFYKSWKFKYKSNFLQDLEILSNRLEGNMRHDSQSLIRLLMGETTFQIWHKWRFKSEKLMGIKEIDGNQVWHRWRYKKDQTLQVWSLELLPQNDPRLLLVIIHVLSPVHVAESLRAWAANDSLHWLEFKKKRPPPMRKQLS
ncbi:hypothetical protein HID58_048295, partial [Brassica napus]